MPKTGAGRPFVGPAGRLLDRALDEAGIARSDAYVTNAVKHFKWEERGKRRIHKTPSANEVRACRPWLLAEIQVIEPRVLVALGATAARALLGPRFRLTQERGRFVASELAPFVSATTHPSAVLRRRSEAERREEMRALVDDLRQVARALAGEAPNPAPRSGRVALRAGRDRPCDRRAARPRQASRARQGVHR